MRILIVKLSSLGDLVHTMPALTDASRAIPGLKADWLVESAFQEIPLWHPSVECAIPVQLRRWKRGPIAALKSGEWQAFYRNLKQESYDMVIDAQGLIKSATLARLARTSHRAGYDRGSAREPMASFFYSHKHAVSIELHAVLRLRQLFAAALSYDLPDVSSLDYGLSLPTFAELTLPVHYFVFLHGTTWENKHWPLAYWRELSELAEAHGRTVFLPWGNESERQRAVEISKGLNHVVVLPRLKITEVANIIANASGVVSVDTGFSHVAAALGVPNVSLYGPTLAKRTGAMGRQQVHLQADFPCSPCFKRRCQYQGTAAVDPACFSTLEPQQVWHALMQRQVTVQAVRA